ncbi:MAG: toprim domain-containing protein [Planctomycetota bacterium]|nr:toprim domain-containing protein [Planctomycetota bacterium]
MAWIRVTSRQRCPICDRPDWCSIAEDGDLIVCMRTESPYPCKSGGWYHGADASRIFDFDDRDIVRTRPAKAKAIEPAPDFAKLAVDYVERLIDIEMPAKELGVSVRSLERLQIGRNGRNYTFPMRDGRERIIGIRVRGRHGKWCVPGSHNGLFWPEGVYRGSDYPLVICEGPTDCAALLDLGYDAIGRPSCMGGVDHVVEFLKGKRRDVVIMSDKDQPKQRPDGSTWRPGQEGAARLAVEIRPLVKTLKIVKPPFHKDVRDWLRAGATRAVVEAVITNTKFFVSERSLRESTRVEVANPPATPPGSTEAKWRAAS